MAKSLRAKSKRAFRNIKRQDPKSDYAIRDKLRVHRLSEKLKVLKNVSDDEEEEEVEEETAKEDEMAVEGQQEEGTSTSTAKVGKAKAKETAEPAKDMAVDEAAPSKPANTHGPRDSARLDWRKKQGMTPGRKRTENNSTTFGKMKSFKSTGKSKHGSKKAGKGK